jgi:putative Mn2+ efflux pump MntP
VHWLFAFLFSLSSNLDNFIVGVGYGIKKEIIPWFSNLLIAIITTVITGLSMMFGKYIVIWLPASLTNLVGAVIFIAIGLWFMANDIFRKQKESVEKHPKILNWKNAIGLGVLLSINNIGVGMLGGITGLSLFSVLTLTFLTCLILTYIGNHLGDHIVGSFIVKNSDLISGAILIILGIGSVWV